MGRLRHVEEPAWLLEHFVEIRTHRIVRVHFDPLPCPDSPADWLGRLVTLRLSVRSGSGHRFGVVWMVRLPIGDRGAGGE